MFKRITLVAHRGYSSQAPENTMAAFELALDRGYKDIEFDVQLTKDGVPVIVHDATLDRTTNGRGLVKNHTHAQLKKLDAGSWFDRRYKLQTIPTLIEVLNNFKDRACLHIELKENQPELPATVALLLQSTGWLDHRPRHPFRRKPRLIISSYDRKLLIESFNLLPGVVHELLVEEVSDESMKWASKQGMRSYHPDGNDITPELVQRARRLNLHVGAWWWTRDEQNARKIKGARYAFVDEPRQHRSVLFKSVMKRIGQTKR